MRSLRSSLCWYFYFFIAGPIIYLLLSAVSAETSSEVDGAPVILEHPLDVIVRKGDPATLNCDASGQDLSISWYKDGEPVITSKEKSDSYRLLLHTGALFLLRVNNGKNGKDADSGTYYCVANNKYGKARSRDAVLKIAMLRDDFRTRPRTVQTVVGGRAILECSPPYGLPEPVVTWKKDENELRLENDDRITLHQGGNLIIEKVERSDGGFYTCVATNMDGQRTSNPARLSVYEKPHFLQEPRNVKAEVGSSVRFDCRVSGDPMPTVAWSKRNDEMPVGRAYIAKDNRGLKIERVQLSDEGEYVCIAKNPAGRIEKSARLRVQAPPSFTKTPVDLTVQSGETAKFECEAEGQPGPAKFWSREGQQDLLFPGHISLDGRVKVTLVGELIIADVRPDDEGNYVCAAMNAAGSSLAKAALKFSSNTLFSNPPPIIEYGHSNQTLTVTTSAILPCQASGRQPPEISWLKNGKPISFDDKGLEGRFQQQATGSLQILHLEKSDTGVYTCRARNEDGESTWTASLIVEEHTNSAVSFHRMSDVASFPSAPGTPTFHNVTDGSVYLEWTPPEKNGATLVTGYLLQYYSPEMGKTWFNLPDYIFGPRFRVKNLKPLHSYVFIVRAENSHGIGPPSHTSNVVRTKNANFDDESDRAGVNIDLDNARQRIGSEQLLKLEEVRSINATAVHLLWKKRRDEPLIQGYYIKWRGPPAATDQTWVNVSGANTESYILNGLKPFTNYEFFIIPYHKTVQGMPSNSLDVTTAEARPTVVPTNARARMMNLTTLRISWGPPHDEGINGILKGFQILVFGSGTKYNRNITTNERAASVTLFHLIHGMKYEIKVAAKNNAGIGEFYVLEPVTMNEETLREHIRLMNGGYGSDRFLHIIKRPWFIAVAGVLIWMIIVAMVAIVWWRWKRSHGKSAGMPFIKINDGSVHLTSRDAPWMKHATLSSPQRSLLLNSSMNGGVCPVPPMYTQTPHHSNFYADGHISHNDYPTVIGETMDRCQSPHHYCYAALPAVSTPGLSTFYGGNPQVMDDPCPYATTTLVMNNRRQWLREQSSRGPTLPSNPIPSAPPVRFKDISNPRSLSTEISSSTLSPKFIDSNKLQGPDQSESPPHTDVSYVQSSDGTGDMQRESSNGVTKSGTLNAGRRSPPKQKLMDFLPPPPTGAPPSEESDGVRHIQGAGAIASDPRYKTDHYDAVSDALLYPCDSKYSHLSQVVSVRPSSRSRTGFRTAATSGRQDDDDSQRSSLMLDENGHSAVCSFSETDEENSEDEDVRVCKLRNAAAQSPEYATNRPSQPCMGVSASALSQSSYEAASTKRSTVRLKAMPRGNKKDIV